MIKILSRLDWDDAWQALLYATCIFFLFLIGTCSLEKKYVTGYSLGDDGGALTIVKGIEWYEDETIKLDRSVTYWDAIRMVDSLNATLK